jgi:low affinity Fe/Cu permease
MYQTMHMAQIVTKTMPWGDTWKLIYLTSITTVKLRMYALHVDSAVYDGRSRSHITITERQRQREKTETYIQTDRQTDRQIHSAPRRTMTAAAAGWPTIVQAHSSAGYCGGICGDSEEQPD